MKIELGDLVKDNITGITGIAIARTIWIAGCDRITLQPIPKKGSTQIPDSLNFDEPLLTLVKKKTDKTKKTNSNTGGPSTKGFINYGRS